MPIPAPPTQNAPLSEEERDLAGRRIDATFTLAKRRIADPDLHKASSEARLDFVAAVLELDRAQEAVDEVPAGSPAAAQISRLLQAQVTAEQAKDAFLESMLCLVRGERPLDA